MVVEAINRLDGRHYALKKIAVDEQTPGSYARIMREVATLSRLQHPHVVRYFQVWRHQPLEMEVGMGVMHCWLADMHCGTS